MYSLQAAQAGGAPKTALAAHGGPAQSVVQGRVATAMEAACSLQRAASVSGQSHQRGFL